MSSSESSCAEAEEHAGNETLCVVNFVRDNTVLLSKSLTSIFPPH
jgi:hypothetical protein